MQSAFASINVEPEESLDEEIDTSRELLIDEALKRFQTALKLHAQGPKYYQEAAASYHHLLQSDIFSLPESTTEFERAERQAQGRDLSAHLPFSHALDVAQADIDGGASSLPQTLYLAYKNHGQFLLDDIRHKAKAGLVEATSLLEDKQVLVQAQKALNKFSTALDHDPSDAELWRRAARVATFLRSARINRYCLEAAIELDDDPAVDEVDPPSLAEGFAGEQLKAQLQVLSDQIALSHPAMGPFVKKIMPDTLKKFVDPLPFLPNPTDSLTTLKPAVDQPAIRQCSIHVLAPSWVDLGLALLAHARANGLSADIIVIDMPDITDGVDDVQTLVERPKTQDMEEEQQPPEVRQTAESSTTSKDDQAKTPKETRIENETTLDDRLHDRSNSVMSRKRSQSIAGLPDCAEDEAIDQKRSKRTRRVTAAAGDTFDSNTLLAAQLQPFQAADKNLFQMTRNIAENLGIEDKATLDRLGEVIDSCASDTRTSKLTRRPMVDLRDSLTKFIDDNAKILLAKKAASPIGLNAFLEHSKPGSQHHTSRPAFHETRGLTAFVQKVNDGCMEIQEVTFQWIQHICASYLNSTWSDAMKRAVVQIINYLHEAIYRRTEYELLRCSRDEDPECTREAIDCLVQMQFELHLDVYERITNPNSAVDFVTRVETKDRLARWFSLAAQLSKERTETDDISLSMRFLWSSVFAVTLTEGAERDHILQCWKSLRDRLSEEKPPVNILLPNNAVMPEVSALAADREISKLTTMDFFLGLFQTDLKDPVSVIESLEPVLNPSSVFTIVDQGGQLDAGLVSRERTTSSSTMEKRPITETASQGLRDLWKFLLGTSTELRLFLWTRLGDAYDAIGYQTKQFSCFLKSIEMIASDFERDPYLGASVETRLPLFMKMLKFLDDLLISALSAGLNETSAFDIVDDEHLRSSIAALAKLSCILHVPSMYEDEVRVGMIQHPSNSATFQSFLNKLRELQVRNWSLLYTLLKAGISQNKSAFPAPENERADYLAAVHQVLGLRKFCKSSNKIFLRMMRVELLKQHMIDNWEDYLGQVLYDLYGLKLGVGLSEVQDHGCPPEKLERRNTMSLVARISILAHRMPMKDLLKSDLKNTIEQMQQAIGQTKSNQQLIQNLRIFNQTLAKPIHPLRLYEAFKGKIAIDAVGVNTADSTLAKHRWFFLLGMIAFTKFKGVDLNRRQTPGATDDLRIGATFLRQQLQFTPDQWDAWFRLAECFDYELDESVLWTADKMNKERAELVKYQRNAIHCYTLGLSHSRGVIFGENEEVNDAIHDLYHKFGMRMYASSREPFAMEPFQHSEHKRFVIHDTGTDTKDVHSQMQDYKVWKYAARLFRKAMEVKPKQWQYVSTILHFESFDKLLTILGIHTCTQNAYGRCIGSHHQPSTVTTRKINPQSKWLSRLLNGQLKSCRRCRSHDMAKIQSWSPTTRSYR
jgi:tetratricopeptide (TPR) repeat protein